MVPKMNRNKNLFNENKKNTSNSNFKYFIIAFSVFVLIVAVFSVVYFMYSLDFDFNNIVDSTTESTSLNSIEDSTNILSVETLSGKSNILFICEEDENIELSFVVATDFDSKKMNVLSVVIDSDLYKENSVNGAKLYIETNYGIKIDKYVITNKTQAKEILSLFDGFRVNVEKNIDYKSKDFNLQLDEGYQYLSSELIFNYLLISDNSTRETIFCDLINSVLKKEYIDNSQKLFTSFVRNCETDISVIDYSENIENLNIYVNANDKFLPLPWSDKQ